MGGFALIAGVLLAVLGFAFGGFEFGEVVGQWGRGEAFAGEAFDAAEEVAFVGITEGDGDAGVSGSACAADAVDVGLGLHGQVEVEDVCNGVDIQASCGDVGGDEDAEAACGEGVECAGALVLGLVAMDCDGGDAVADEFFGNAVGAVLGFGEDDAALGGGVGQQVHEQGGLALFGQEVEALFDLGGGGGDGCYSDLDGLLEQGVGQVLDLAWHCGAKEHGLACGGECGADAFDGDDEAHVEHAVGLVEDEDLHVGEVDVALLFEVFEPAWGGDEDVDACAQGADLLGLAYAAEDDGVAEGGVPAVGCEAVADLAGEFACGAEDEDAWEVPAIDEGVAGGGEQS